jgi:AraC family L-rhamnose operon regulatory protein RhaS
MPGRAEGLEIIRLARGHAVWAVDGVHFPVKEHEVVFVLPGQLFSGIESSDAVPVRAERILIQMPSGGGGSVSGLARALGQALGVSESQAAVVVDQLRAARPPRVNAGTEGARLCQEVLHYARPATAVEESYLNACVFTLLCRLCLRLEGKPGAGAPADSENRVARFLRELEDRSAEPWTLEAMAEETGLKRSRFGSICRQLTGENPITFLTRLRVRASRRLLRDSKMSITDIAMDCGFGSSQYFSRIFRRYQGYEPTHFRQLAAETLRGRGVHYLKGDAARTIACADQEIGPGDFTVDCRLTLDRLGGTAASLELGGDRFGFDGRQGCFFCEGETFGSARIFTPTHKLIREGEPFGFRAERKGSAMCFVVNDTQVGVVADSAGRRVGVVGLRPLRNGITIHSFLIDGREVALKNMEDRD